MAFLECTKVRLQQHSSQISEKAGWKKRNKIIRTAFLHKYRAWDVIVRVSRGKELREIQLHEEG